MDCSIIHSRRSRWRRGSARGFSAWWLAGLFALAASAAEWQDIAPGISFREFVQPGPVRVFVTRADRAAKSWTIDSMKARGEVKGGKETVPEMVARYDGTITADGHRYAIRAAINGDYYDMQSGVTLSGQFLSGWYARRFTEMGGLSGFVWTADRRCFLGGNVNNNATRQRVTFASGAVLKIQQLNEPRKPDSLVLFTPQFAENTGTTDDGVEVCVRVASPVGFSAAKSGVRGEILKIRDGQGSAPLLFNHVVLSAQGKAAKELRQHARVGESLSIHLGLQDTGRAEIGLAAGDWAQAYAGIGATKYVLVNGVVPRDWEAKAAQLARAGKKYGGVVKDPRTAIAFNEHAVFFLVIDGRSTRSTGMTYTEAGEFCRDTLKATDATLQDGGGSSTLWVDGQVRNTPSGKGKDEKAGVLRAVANGLFMAEVLPPEKSSAFASGQRVRLKSCDALSPGPGAAGKIPVTAADKTSGRVVAEPLNGILARGEHWWFCRFGEIDGWAAAAQLTAGE